MSFSSMDDIINAISALGQFSRTDWNKNTPNIAAATAGCWYDLSLGAGAPMINSILGGGTNLTFQALTEATTTTAQTAATSGNISTTTFTDTTHGSGRFTVGSILSGTGVVAGTYITALGTGTGANNGGTYTINISQTVTNQTITGTQYPGSIPHGGDVSPATKHLLNASCLSGAATSAPIMAMLIDQVACFPISTLTTTGAQTFLGTQTLPRYADGKGLRAYLVPVIATGAGASTIQLSYTNPASTAGRTTPVPLPIPTASCPVGQLIASGTGAGKYGPFIPLQGGDSGILSVQSINISTSLTSGCLALVLCKPLATFPITTVGVAAERDFLNQLPSLPRIYDGACLNVLLYAGAAVPATTGYVGHVDTAWRN